MIGSAFIPDSLMNISPMNISLVSLLKFTVVKASEALLLTLLKSNVPMAADK